MPAIGDILGEKYLLKRLVGQGGMGSVYEAEHVVLGKSFAIKLLHSHYAMNAEVFKRFQLEAQSAAAIGHRGIVDVYDIGRSEEGAPFLVMELLEGEGLAELLERHETLEIGLAVEIVAQSLSALVAVHAKKIVHRDLKPENIYVTREDEGIWRTKILDFGISKVTGPDALQLTLTGSVLGTAHFMSPEQARGAKDVDVRADIWAAGAILYRALSGRLPFEGDSYNEVLAKILTDPVTPPRSARPEIPEGLEHVVLKALAKDRDERFEKTEDFLEGLQPFRAKRGEEPSPWDILSRRDVEDDKATRAPASVRAEGSRPHDLEDSRPTEAYEVATGQEVEQPEVEDVMATTPHPLAQQQVAETPPAYAQPSALPQTSMLPADQWNHLTPPWQKPAPGQPDTFDVGMKDAPQHSPLRRLVVVALLGIAMAVLLGVGFVTWRFQADRTGASSLDRDDVTASVSSETPTPPPPPEDLHELPAVTAPTPEVTEAPASTSTVGVDHEQRVQNAEEAPEQPLQDEEPTQPTESVESVDPPAETAPAVEKRRQPTRREIAAALRPHQSRFKRCIELTQPAPAVVRVKVRITGAGVARYESATPAPPAKISSCLRDAVNGVRITSSRVTPTSHVVSVRSTPRQTTPTKRQGGLWTSPFN